MQNYKAPKTDTLFVMNEVFNFAAHYQRLGFADATPDLVDAIYAEAAKFAEEVLAPINAIGAVSYTHLTLPTTPYV